MSHYSGEMPYPSAILDRLTNVEKRVTKIEDRALPVEVAVIVERLDAVKHELEGLKRMTYAALVILIMTVGVLVPILIRR